MERKYIYIGRDKNNNTKPMISICATFSDKRAVFTFAFLNADCGDRFNRKDTKEIHNKRATDGASISLPYTGTLPTYAQTVKIANRFLYNACTDGSNEITGINIPTWARKVIRKTCKA